MLDRRIFSAAGVSAIALLAAVPMAAFGQTPGNVARNKTLIVLGYVLIPIVLMAQAGAWSLAGFSALIAPIALNWFLWTLLVVLGRVTYLVWKHDFRISMIWFIKLITDPLTDIVAYFPRWAQRA